eukprot:Skav223829  [mRNA]  locus=scaffold3121:102999:105145:- [translate_table: standard]
MQAKGVGAEKGFEPDFRLKMDLEAQSRGFPSASLSAEEGSEGSNGDPWPDTDEELEWTRRDEAAQPQQPQQPQLQRVQLPFSFHLAQFVVLQNLQGLQGQSRLDAHATYATGPCGRDEPLTPSTASCGSLPSLSEAKSSGERDPPTVQRMGGSMGEPKPRASRKTRDMLPERSDLQPRGLKQFQQIRTDGSIDFFGASSPSSSSSQFAPAALPVGRVVRAASPNISP